MRATVEFQCDRTGLIRFDIGRPNHLGPFFGFLNDKLAEIVGRARHLDAAQIGDPCFHIRIDQGRVDLLVEDLDDIGGRALRCGDSVPRALLIAFNRVRLSPEDPAAPPSVSR